MNTDNNHNCNNKFTIKSMKYIFATVLLVTLMTANMSASSENHSELTFLERAVMQSLQERSATEELSAVEELSAMEKFSVLDQSGRESSDMYINRVQYPYEDTNKIKITVDGNRVQDPIIDQGTAYIPVRQYFSLSNIGEAEITWDETTSTAEIKTKNLLITIQKSSNYITSNERVFYSPSETFVKDGVMYVPARILAASTGASIEWNESENRIIIQNSGGTIEHGDAFYDDDDLLWLARIIHAESRGEPFEGQLAVGSVILNRLESPDYPDTIYDVIFDTKFGVQFTPAGSGTIYNDPDPLCVSAAKICLEGYRISSSIKYFINQKLATTTWVTTRSFAMNIGNHDFYS